ncbi:MAG: hypothetical protein WCR58_07125 [Bacteroidales bacterium]|jgi:hypothetical protein|nr:hypothetical protein [Bacteroidales bacterium]MDD3702043.1 hypothetical protein [Bacteroidales bacterium]MDY0369710.1 hypothetical protein [Bacteroidales bacterium]
MDKLKYSLILLLILTSCSAKKTVIFTRELHQKVIDFGLDLEDIQFYNSHKIVLRRTLSFEQAKVASGKIRFENGQYIESIIIKKNTPGILEHGDDKSLDIAFESGENRQLSFVRNPRDHYQVSAQEWVKKMGKVPYDTTVYYILPGGEKSLLKVRQEDIFRFKKKERIVTGRTVSIRKPTDDE